MQPMYYIGLNVHKRKISYCVKDSGGNTSRGRHVIPPARKAIFLTCIGKRDVLSSTESSLLVKSIANRGFLS
jgi:hypothetical protein